jgi:hypothetical protein
LIPASTSWIGLFRNIGLERKLPGASQTQESSAAEFLKPALWTVCYSSDSLRTEVRLVVIYAAQERSAATKLVNCKYSGQDIQQ